MSAPNSSAGFMRSASKMYRPWQERMHPSASSILSYPPKASTCRTVSRSRRNLIAMPLQMPMRGRSCTGCSMGSKKTMSRRSRNAPPPRAKSFTMPPAAMSCENRSRNPITSLRRSMALAPQLRFAVQLPPRISPPPASGVTFTLDTESGFRDVLFITGAYGLGESIVQGLTDPDEFYVHKPTKRATGPF